MNLMQQNNNLELFFQKNVIDLKDYPSDDIKEKVSVMKITIFDFNGVNKLVAREVKMFLQMILKQNYLKATLREYIRALTYLLDFLKENPHITTLESVPENLEDLYKGYLEEKGLSVTNSRNYPTPSYAILFKLQRFIIADYGNANLFERDIWLFKYIPIDESRYVGSIKKEFNYMDVIGGKNKRALKEYIRYLLLNTDNSVSTIGSKLTSIKSLINYLGKKVLLSNITRDVVEGFLNELNNRELKNQTYNIIINHVNEFVEYLIAKDIMSMNYFYHTDKKRVNREHSYRTVDNFVIEQIFSNLNKIPFEESCMFLILYTTGMRLNEMCRLKLNSLKNENNKYILQYYSPKMRKEVVNYIPKSLYDLLIIHKRAVIKTYGANNEYLFLNSKKDSYNQNTFRERLNKWFKELGIKNSDGSYYTFKAHDYRHTLATNMILNDIPSAVIQKVLHHESIEMTAAYTDIQDEDKKQDYKKFINIKGEYISLETDSYFDLEDLADVEWLKKSINAQMLPNGMCSLPIAMGKCPHANSCLTCGHFRTGKEFLPVHEQHYERICSLVDYAKEQGWQRQIETNETVKENLETIISTLKV